MNTNRYDPMPASYGDDGEIEAFVGAGKAPEPEPVNEEKPEEKPPVKKAAGRPKKAVAVSEDEQGTTAKN